MPDTPVHLVRNSALYLECYAVETTELLIEKGIYWYGKQSGTKLGAFLRTSSFYWHILLNSSRDEAGNYFMAVSSFKILIATTFLYSKQKARVLPWILIATTFLFRAFRDLLRVRMSVTMCHYFIFVGSGFVIEL